MTALGFLLFCLGYIWTNVFCRPFGIDWRDYVSMVLLIPAIVLLISGVTTFLWNTMP